MTGAPCNIAFSNSFIFQDGTNAMHTLLLLTKYLATIKKWLLTELLKIFLLNNKR